jgi:uncharacterized membrane protein (UPF0136 family)
MANVQYQPDSIPVSFTLSLLSAIVIIISSVIAQIFFYDPGYNFGLWMTIVSPLIGVISGIVIFIGAILMFKKPRQGRIWSVIILLSSSAALIGIGSLAIIGSALGIIGGISSINRRIS